MNKAIFLFFFVFIQMSLYAQQFKLVNDAQSLTWFGLDFTKAKMVGDFSGPINVSYGYQVTTIDGTEVTPKIIRDDLYKAWNNLVLNEPKKYNLKEFFGDKNIAYSTVAVMKLNSQIDLDSIKIAGGYSEVAFSKEKIQEMVYRYKTDNSSTANGIGVTLIIEKFDKIEKIGKANVVFFDISTCQVLFSDYLEGEPGGYGLRNYWGGSIYKMLESVKDNKWKKWKKS